MTKMKFRQYKEKDKEIVWKLHVSGLNQHCRFVFDPKLDSDFEDIKGNYINNNGDFFIVEINNKVVGMGALKKVNKKTVELKRIRVDAKHQKKGIGSLIMEKLLSRAQELEYKRIILYTSIKQIPAQRLYKKYGFKEYKREKRGNSEKIFYEINI